MPKKFHITLKYGNECFKADELGRESDLLYSNRQKSLNEGIYMQLQSQLNKSRNLKKQNCPKNLRNHISHNYKREQACYVSGDASHFASVCTICLK